MRARIERSGLIIAATCAALIYWYYGPVVTGRSWTRVLVIGLVFLLFTFTQYLINARKDAEEAARRDRQEKLQQKIKQRLKQLDPAQGEIKKKIPEHKAGQDEVKRYEEQTFHDQKVEALETPIGCTARDFNNLLHAISGYTQFLLMKKDPEDPDYGKIAAIQRSAQRAGELTRQLLIFGRKGGRKSGYADLNYEVIETCKILERALPETIKIERNLASGLQAVNIDPTQIEQVILNLGINAGKTMPDGGELVFQTENVHPEEESIACPKDASSGPYVLLTVSDTGGGMDEAGLQKIFECSYPTGDIGQGDGIEISIVYDIVRSYGGYLQGAATPGGGSTFKVFLPALQKEIVERIGAKVSDADVPPSPGEETILLIDDEKPVLDIGKNLLEQYGYRAVLADNDKEALEILQRENGRVSLVILDSIMPGIKGDKCYKEILRLKPDLKIIISKGGKTDESEEEIFDPKPAGYISKPYKITDMLMTIREVLDRK